MPLEQLRTLAAAVIAASAIAASCGRAPRAATEPAVAGPRLGESTASPGADPDRPIAGSIDTHDVSAPISRLPAGPLPAGEPPPPAPPDAGSPGVFSPPPDAAP